MTTVAETAGPGRCFALVPEDEGEGLRCPHHGRRLVERDIRPIYEGDFHLTGADYVTLTCPACCEDLAAEHDTNSAAAFKAALRATMDQWKAGKTPEDWFFWVGERAELGGGHVGALVPGSIRPDGSVVTGPGGDQA